MVEQIGGGRPWVPLPLGDLHLGRQILKGAAFLILKLFVLLLLFLFSLLLLIF